MPGRVAGLVAAGLLSAISTSAALAQDGRITEASPGSWQEIAGRTILHFVGGRSLDEASGPSFNPYEIDVESLLYSLGSFFLNTDYTGSSIREGEVSLIAHFSTPLGAFAPSAKTPGIIPFALVKNGLCYGGYVAGFPAPDTIYSVAMADDICHAAIVEEIVYAQYVAENPSTQTDGGTVTEPGPEFDFGAEPTTTVTGFDPGNPLDIDLDVIVWAAYNAAYNLAIADPDYLFIRDGNYTVLREAVVAELQKEGLPGVTVAAGPSESPDAAFGCAPAGTTELRVAFSSGDLGITLVAASARSVSSYRYDPDVSYDLDIDYAQECKREGLARARPGTVR